MNSPEQTERPRALVLEMIDVAIAAIHRPEATVLDHVQWTVEMGDYWIVGGLPDSGKTDLLTTAAGLMRPRRGVVRLFGNDISQRREDERLATQLRAGIVFGAGGPPVQRVDGDREPRVTAVLPSELRSGG